LEGVERVLLRGGTAAGGRGESVGVRTPQTGQEEERTGRKKGGRRLENNISSPSREEDSGERDRRKSPGSRTRRRRFVRAD